MIHFLINQSECSEFELDMMSNARIEGLLMPDSIETTKNAQYLFSYKEPHDKKTINELIDDDYFGIIQYQNLLRKIIVMKQRLVTYMLSNHKLNYCVESIWYDPVINDFQFIYLPHLSKSEIHELNFYRHIFIESSQLFHYNTKLLLELKKNCFDLENFCASFEVKESKGKKHNFWIRFLISKEESYNIHKNKTIQKSRKSCLLDVLNPTIFHELHFNNVTIGRSDECNICIDEQSISRKHALICKNKHQFTLEDLDSSNGTYHNGQPIKKVVTLVNGDKLQFGDKEFIFIL